MTKRPRLHQEVADAYNVLKNELPSKQARPSTARVIVDYAKQLQRAQTKARRLRKELKRVEQDIRVIKRMLKGVVEK
jgi:hypothetical protein